MVKTENAKISQKFLCWENAAIDIVLEIRSMIFLNEILRNERT